MQTKRKTSLLSALAIITIHHCTATLVITCIAWLWHPRSFCRRVDSPLPPEPLVLHSARPFDFPAPCCQKTALMENEGKSSREHANTNLFMPLHETTVVQASETNDKVPTRCRFHFSNFESLQTTHMDSLRCEHSPLCI